MANLIRMIQTEVRKDKIFVSLIPHWGMRRKGNSMNTKLSYEQIKVMENIKENKNPESLDKMARDTNVAIQRYVATNENTKPETLEFLAKSEDIYTKRYVAANPNTPAEVIERLLNDGIYNELPASKEETKLVNDLMMFYEDYDTYGFNDSTNGYEADFDETLSSIREPKSRSEIVNFLQSVIEDTADMANPTEMTDNSRARQLIKDIAEYSCQIIEINADNTKSNIMEEKAMENQDTQQTQESTAKYFNKHLYGEIENKAFISCDAKTAYAIGQKAQEQGVTFSAKYDGDKSSIVIDGVKDKAFIDAVKAEFKVHTADEPTFFNSRVYKDIENKAFISCDAKTAYAIGQKAQEQGVTFSAKYDGDKSSIVIDGVKDKAFIDAVKAEFKVHTADEPTYYNRKAYKDIENKEYINTDAKTAYAIGQKAQEQGVTFSAKFDGDKSAVTVDGVKDKAFVDAVKKEFNIIDKLDEVLDIADKIEEAFDNGELDKDDPNRGQER